MALPPAREGIASADRRPRRDELGSAMLLAMRRFIAGLPGSADRTILPPPRELNLYLRERDGALWPEFTVWTLGRGKNQQELRERWWE
jgi:hypothetical protein